MPAPTPSRQLMTMRPVMLRANRQAAPLRKKSTSPTVSVRSLPGPSDSLPDNSTNGMMSSDGSDVSIWISRSVALGKMPFRSPRMGETAKPGNDEMAETDQTASSTTSGIVPLPVSIFISPTRLLVLSATVVPKALSDSSPAMKHPRRRYFRQGWNRKKTDFGAPSFRRYSFTQRICMPPAL